LIETVVRQGKKYNKVTPAGRTLEGAWQSCCPDGLCLVSVSKIGSHLAGVSTTKTTGTNFV
jgi:hypothetical protein